MPEQEIFIILDRGVNKEAKYCLNCSKIFTNRKKWKNNFKEVKFCSDRCKNEYKKKL